MTKFDDIIHQPVRLQIMSSLMAIEINVQVDFSYLRELLKLTDGNLGAHLAKLENAGYLKIEKTFVDRKPRTYIATTGKGRDAFAGHVKALEQIIQSKQKTKS